MTGTWGRRAITIPAVVCAFLLTSALFPALLVLALAVDLVRHLTARRPFAGVRVLVFGLVYLGSQLIGLGALAWVWLATLPAGERREERLVSRTFAVQRTWASALFRAVCLLFGLKLEVEGDRALEQGPFIVFIRHASIIDTLLPTVLVTARHDVRLRFVLKRELLADPCLDVAGLRLPNYFARRTGDDRTDIEGVAELGRGLGPKDGVLLYPEGTRFSVDKHRRALVRLSQEAPELYAMAKSLTHLLPPRLGGALALLEAASEADAVFFAHHGLDGFASVGDIFRYALARRELAVKVWRVPRREIPEERGDRVRWLFEQWQIVNDWVAARAKEGE